MVHSFRQNGAKRYGPSSTRERQNERGAPSSDTAKSRELEGAGEALRREPEDGCQVEEAKGGGRSADRAARAEIDGAER